MDEAQQATIRKTEADTDAVYIQAGVLDPSEVRQRLTSDTNSPYDGLDPDDMPETPDMGAGAPEDEDEAEGANPFAADSGEWDESQHPRAENGRFGRGSSVSSRKPKKGENVDIRDIVQRSISGKDNRVYSDFAKVSEQTANAIKENLGVDVTGWAHSITEGDVRHILKQHGNEETEGQRGQRAVTQQDIERLPELLSEFDDIEFSGLNELGNETFIVKKVIGEDIYCAQEVRVGRQKLVVKSMWIKKRKGR